MTTLSNYNLFMFITKREYGRERSIDEHASVDKLHAILNEMLATASAEEDQDLEEARNRAFGEPGDSGEGDDAADNDAEEYRNRAAIDEAVFLQSYIPTSLHEFSNPQAELKRLQAGQREQVYESAIKDMLGGAGDPLPSSAHSYGSNAAMDQPGDATLDGVETEEGMDESDDDSDASGSSSEAESGKYRRRLPTTDDPEARAAMKAAKKEARRLAKAEAALKRTKKIPKHVKKRAVKSGKK
jgi:hypothetical protein